MAKGDKPGTRSATAASAAEKGKAPVPLVSTPPVGNNRIPRKDPPVPIENVAIAVKRNDVSPAGDGASSRKRFIPNPVRRGLRLPGNSGVSASAAQEDVKGMLAAVKEEPKESQEDVVLLSSQLASGRSQQSQPVQTPPRDPTQIVLSRPTSQRSDRRKKTASGVPVNERPTFGQLRLPGAPHGKKPVMSDDDNDEVEFIEPAQTGSVPGLKNSKGGHTSFGGEISDTAEGTNAGLNPFEKIWTSR